MLILLVKKKKEGLVKFVLITFSTKCMLIVIKCHHLSVSCLPQICCLSCMNKF